jgi:hypothetical protein
MKKLMITAAAVALVGGAFATNIFDYKATVKYVDLKTATVKNSDGVKVKALFKVVKSATLTGYLVTPLDCPCNYEGPLDDCRFGQIPGFLVLKNASAAKNNGTVSTVKLMPANLLTEWWTTKELGTKKLTLEAQGYLFAGVGKRDVPDPEKSPFYGLGDHETDLKTAGTKFLFGLYNDEDVDEFIEPFLDQAGFGKAAYDPETGGLEGCVWGSVDGGICLTSLAGNLIGGSFMCYPNGVWVNKAGTHLVWDVTEGFICQDWDNFAKENMTSEGTTQELPKSYAEGLGYYYNVVSGTWSIKANPKMEQRAINAGYDTEKGYVEYVGKQLDKAFNLDTFDVYKSAKRAKDDKLDGNFVAKWFVAVQ